jgi:enduracididine biosynthesis enzyme MppP
MAIEGGAVVSTSANLTELETRALEAAINVADGHARQYLTPAQQQIVDDFPRLFKEAERMSYPELNARAMRALMRALGQHEAPIAESRFLTCYASSVAMEILARALSDRFRSVGLIHPTFDNIPDILRGLRIDLTPLGEPALLSGDVSDVLPPGVGCVFITTPNNPTGTVLPEERLALIARACEHRDVVLVLDTSFRGFDPRAQYDHYAVLERAGCRYVVIEDTGKIWPTLDLKLGCLVLSDRIDLPIARVYSDILLNVSPFVLAMVEKFAEDAAGGGLPALQAGIAENRRLLRSTLAYVPNVSFPDPDSRVSVERVLIGDGRDAVAAWETLRQRGVHVLPCRPFHWANGSEGDAFIRVALARPPAVVEAAGRALASALTARA